jgi:hypothetical protein
LNGLIELLTPSYGPVDDAQTAYRSPFDIAYDWAPEATSIDITDPRHRPHRPYASATTRSTPTPTAPVASAGYLSLPATVAATLATTVAATTMLALPAPPVVSPSPLLIEHIG